jgi:hypothetical protein
MCAVIDGNIVNSVYGTEDQDAYFYLDNVKNVPVVPSQPQAPAQALLGPINTSTDSGGWQPVEAANFNLPPGVTNPCN